MNRRRRRHNQPRRPGSRSLAARPARALFLLLALLGSTFLAPRPARTEEKKEPKGNNGVFSAGGILKGKYHHLRFIIPFRGDFSQYNKVEIVQPESDLGPDTVPAEKIEQYTRWLQQLFLDTGLFEEVRIVQETTLGSAAASVSPAEEEVVRAELAGFPLPAGLDPDEEFTGIPAEDTVLLIQPAAVPEKHTLVVTSTVLDYLKGNRGLRMLGVGIGGSRFTVRFSIYDKQTGAEVARGNVTGAVEDTSFGLPGGSGSDQSLKVGAADLVYHVERRVREADR
ncbi:MAG: hypothetical protein V3R29_09085 [Candidatus Acidoferrales bacterium]